MHQLPTTPGAYLLAALACAVLGLLCLLAATITAAYEHRHTTRTARHLLADDDSPHTP
jgi:hypothetical protein